MHAIKKTVKTPANHKVTINIPSYVPKDEPVEVILIMEDNKEKKEKKLLLMKKAINDPVYLNDIEDINRDFEAIDLSNWQ